MEGELYALCFPRELDYTIVLTFLATLRLRYLASSAVLPRTRCTGPVRTVDYTPSSSVWRQAGESAKTADTRPACGQG